MEIQPSCCADYRKPLSVIADGLCAYLDDLAARMRELLLEHGADESAYERRRWEERCAADAGEAAWLQNFHRSA